MNITVKEDNGQYYIDLKDFKNLVDVSKVEYYYLQKENSGFKITFYDKNQNILKIKEESNEI